MSNSNLPQILARVLYVALSDAAEGKSGILFILSRRVFALYSVSTCFQKSNLRFAEVVQFLKKRSHQENIDEIPIKYI